MHLQALLHMAVKAGSERLFEFFSLKEGFLFKIFNVEEIDKFFDLCRAEYQFHGLDHHTNIHIDPVVLAHGIGGRRLRRVCHYRLFRGDLLLLRIRKDVVFYQNQLEHLILFIFNVSF